jgi:predicted DNA-binding protein
MGAGKTKVISLRIEEELYRELEKYSSKKSIAIAQYVREILYSYHYPTKETISMLEDNKVKLDSSIENAREYFEKLMEYSDYLRTAIDDFEKKVNSGAIQFPLRREEVQSEK